MTLGELYDKLQRLEELEQQRKLYKDYSSPSDEARYWRISDKIVDLREETLALS